MPSSTSISRSAASAGCTRHRCSAHVAACQDWLEREIARVKPAVIVTLGATALAAVSGTRVAIAAARNTDLRTASGLPIVATYHPSAVLRVPDERGPEADADGIAGGSQARRSARQPVTDAAGPVNLGQAHLRAWRDTRGGTRDKRRVPAARRAARSGRDPASCWPWRARFWIVAGSDDSAIAYLIAFSADAPVRRRGVRPA
jgi:hypothetical protein